MARRLLQYKWYLVALLAMMIIVPTISSYLTFLLQKIYNEVTVGTSITFIFRLVLQGVLVWLVNRLLFYSQTIIKSRLICNIKQDLKHDIFVSALGLKGSNIFERAATGEYISIFSNDINIIEQRYFSVWLDLISQTASIAIFFSAFFTMNRKLAFFVMAFAIGVMFVPSIFAKQLNRSSLNYSRKISNFTQGIKEFIQAFPTIKSYAVEDVILDKFDIRNKESEDSKFLYDSSLALADGIGSLLTWFARMVVIGAGLIMVSKGEILLGTVVAAQSFSVQLATPLQLIVQDINSIRSIKSIVGKISDLTTDHFTDKKDADTYTSFSTDPEEIQIEFSNLFLRIGEKTIIEDFTYTFNPRKKYLILGKNGAGKSSVFKALKGRFGEISGSIKINGVDFNKYSNKDISRMVTYLGENVSLFTGSVSDNITFWRNISQDSLHRAARESHLNLSLNRQVGDEGYNISSGEQRRIEIARGLIEPVGMIVFDEIVSTLDIETAYEIENTALSYQDKTVVFISHNFSGKLIKLYDEILIMENGRLLAHGSYEDLLNTCDYFRHICEIKFGTL
ncbi:MAG: ABC transporter ATP-binding protein/permease [Lachnospiraceae bacterium]|nr:ABC transporter ATP-binding protein/permease [Lachnospiraceae bacterium]